MLMMPVLDDDDISLQSVIASRAGSIVGFQCLCGSGFRNKQAKTSSRPAIPGSRVVSGMRPISSRR